MIPNPHNPIPNHAVRILLPATAAILIALAAAALLRDRLNQPGLPVYPLVAPVPPPQPIEEVPPIDEQAVRRQAWQLAEPLLAQAEQAAATALDQHLASIPAFLAQRKPGARPFAQALLSLRGKWELVKAQIAGDSEQEYAAFLSQAFRKHLFPPEELKQTVAAAVSGYLAELEGIHEQLLVRLRADLADGLPAAAAILPAIRSDEAFQSHYHELAGRVAQDLRIELAYVAGRETLSWSVLPNLVNALTQRVLTALAVRAGYSAAGLSASTGFSLATFGASLVAFFVLDYVITEIVKAAGYDAEDRVTERISQALDELGRTITEGDSAARADLAKLKAMQQDDPDAHIRAACAEAIQSIEAGSLLYGLRRELTTLTAERASLRKQTLRRFLNHPEANP